MTNAYTQAEQWLAEHPHATPREAYLAGYWQECRNWAAPPHRKPHDTDRQHDK